MVITTKSRAPFRIVELLNLCFEFFCKIFTEVKIDGQKEESFMIPPLVARENATSKKTGNNGSCEVVDGATGRKDASRMAAWERVKAPFPFLRFSSSLLFPTRFISAATVKWQNTMGKRLAANVPSVIYTQKHAINFHNRA